MNQDFKKTFKKAFKRKYLMPDDAKRIMAEKNTRKLIRTQIFIISLCSILSIITFFFGRRPEANYPFIYFNYFTMIIGGLISLIGCLYVKKHPDMRPSAQMFPIHFSATYTYVLLALIFYSEQSILNSFLIFASISVITPLYFDLEPIVFFVLEIGVTIAISHITFPVAGLAPTIDIYIFAILTTILSFNKWKTAKYDYQYKKSQKEHQDRIEKEISLASLVQSSFFKHEDTFYDDWAIAYYTKAMSGVSGDFIDIYNNNNKLDGIGLFDVSGHGIASGLVTMLVKNIINHEFYRGKSDNLKTVVDRINVRYLNEKGNIENYLTGILCRIKGNTVDFVNAGHSLPIFYKNSEEHCIEIKTENSEGSYGAIGLIGMPNNFLQHSIEMETGDELILFTDGITDTNNETHEAFGRERLIRSINRNADRPLSTQINCIISDVINYAHGRPLEDDITMIILKKK